MSSNAGGAGRLTIRLSTLLKWTLLLSILSLLGLWAATLILPLRAGVERLIGTAALLAGSSLAALPCASCREQARLRPLMLSGLIAAAVAAAGWLAVLWLSSLRGLPLLEVIGKDLAAITIWAGLCTIVAVLFVRRIPGVLARWVRGPTIAAAAALALVIFWTVWIEADLSTADALVTYIGVLSVTTAFGIVTTLLLAVLGHPGGAEEEDPDGVARLDLTLTCPRCGERQPFRTGRGRCRRCGLGIRIAVP